MQNKNINKYGVIKCSPRTGRKKKRKKIHQMGQIGKTMGQILNLPILKTALNERYSLNTHLKEMDEQDKSAKHNCMTIL